MYNVPSCLAFLPAAALTFVSRLRYPLQSPSSALRIPLCSYYNRFEIRLVRLQAIWLPLSAVSTYDDKVPVTLVCLILYFALTG